MGKDPQSGSVITLKSPQGSLPSEGTVFFCVAPRGRDSTKGDREANRGISCLAGRQGPLDDGMQRGWRAGEGAEGVYQEGQV